MYIAEALKLITPLDLIFFRGVDFISRIVTEAEREIGCDRFSHVGLIVNSEILPSIKELEPGKFYIWESTSTDKKDPVVDVEDQEHHFGVQIRPLEEALEVYSQVKSGTVTWGPLKENPWTDTNKRAEIIATLDKVHADFGRRTYEANFLSLLAVVFPRLRRVRDLLDIICIDGYKLFRTWKSSNEVGPPNVPIAGWLFCSELIAVIYENLGVLPKENDVRNMAPVDFIGVRSPYPNLTRELIELQL